MDTEVIERLWGIIVGRKNSPIEGSYTNRMLEAPEELYGKIIEEAGELVDAAKNSRLDGKDSLAWEGADLMYHMMVLCASKGVDFNDVLRELKSRMK